MDDRELLYKLKKDPSEGIRLLIGSYSALVFFVLRGRLSSVCGKDELEELASDVFTDFYTSLARFDPNRGSIKAYLCRIASNVASERYSDIKKEERIFAAFEYGFDLVYGEDIYKVGSPSGELWSYEKYVKVLSEFGDEFDLLYAEYEKFLTEYELWGEVSDDIGLYWEKLEGWYLQKVKDESSNVYFELINAREQYIRENPRSFDEKSKFGIAAASLDIKVFDKDGHAYIFVTSEQFEALCEQIDGNNMIFDLASKNAFDSEFDADGNPINADTTEITEAPVPETEAEEITDVLYEADTTCVEGSMYEEETSIYSLSPETGK